MLGVDGNRKRREGGLPGWFVNTISHPQEEGSLGPAAGVGPTIWFAVNSRAVIGQRTNESYSRIGAEVCWRAHLASASPGPTCQSLLLSARHETGSFLAPCTNCPFAHFALSAPCSLLLLLLLLSP